MEIDEGWYISEGMLYSLWKYLNGKRLTGKDTLKFEDLRASQETTQSSAANFVIILNVFLVGLHDSRFLKEEYLDHLSKIKKTNAFIESKEAKENISKILANEYTLKDIENILRHDNTGIVDFFEFSANVLPFDRRTISSILKHFVDGFTSNSLKIGDKNRLNFEEQKRFFFQYLEADIKKFGNMFIFEFPKLSNENVGNEEFLFVHTLIALENIKYVKVEKIWSDADNDVFKIKMELTQKCLEDNIIKDFKKTRNAGFRLLLEYGNDRYLKINGIILARPYLDSSNDKILKFLYDHPESFHGKDEIKKSTREVSSIKNFNDFLNQINIKGILRDYLVEKNKTKIRLKTDVLITDEKDQIQAKKLLKELRNKKHKE